MSREAFEYQGIPGHILGGTRWVATHYGWDRIKQLVREKFKWRCVYCNRYDRYGDAHHPYGRGGGKREDRLEFPSGLPNLEYVCRDCHNGLEIKRLPFGVYGGPCSDETSSPVEVESLPDSNALQSQTD